MYSAASFVVSFLGAAMKDPVAEYAAELEKLGREASSVDHLELFERFFPSPPRDPVDPAEAAAELLRRFRKSPPGC